MALADMSGFIAQFLQAAFTINSIVLTRPVLIQGSAGRGSPDVGGRSWVAECGVRLAHCESVNLCAGPRERGTPNGGSCKKARSLRCQRFMVIGSGSVVFQ